MKHSLVQSYLCLYHSAFLKQGRIVAMYESIEPANDWLAAPPGIQERDELPMVVWLTGNEPYFTEFSLDAEAVMERLALKRSRLTQISGKELRVGRAKMGRYIRPVYRECDVEAYLAWVKPTASHKKSSSVIEEAVQHLETQTEVSIRSLHTLLGDFSTETRSIFGQQLARQTEQLQTALHHQRQEILPPLTAQLAHDTRVSLRIETALGELQARVEALAAQQREFLSIQEALARMLSLLQMQQAESTAHWREVQGELESLREMEIDPPVVRLLAKAPISRWYQGKEDEQGRVEVPSLGRRRGFSRRFGFQGMPMS
jgi:hypothetical protein